MGNCLIYMPGAGVNGDIWSELGWPFCLNIVQGYNGTATVVVFEEITSKKLEMKLLIS